MEKDDSVYVEHIFERLTRIADYTNGDRERFLSDIKTQDAVLRNLHTMAESAGRLSDRFKVARPDVPWRNIAGFRNVIVHDYLGISPEEVWDLIEQDIPDFESAMRAIRGSP